VTIVAGIDEAGYGPHVGPLVVAAAAYRLEDDAREADLDRIVSDKAVRAEGLPTADSKQLFHSGGSVKRIEMSTLGHMALSCGCLPVRVAGLLNGALDFSAAEAGKLPWYAKRLMQTALPRVATFDELQARTDWHRDWLEKRGARFESLILAPVLVPRFNRLTQAAGSKAWTLFHTTGRLIETLVKRFPDEKLVIHIDRQGGRIHYGSLLQTFFPMAPLTTVREKPESSAYRMDWPGRSPVAIDFRVKADGRRAPVALASVAAKTVREQFMFSLNEWFVEQLDELKPTAGYGTDGRRFLDEVLKRLPAMSRRRGQLERCR
jgi:ribonuclease HII